MELPSGTVTLLFSDMEGSTRLLDRLGDRYVEVLSAQREVLRAAWTGHGGIELGTEGDSFYVVFASASAGVAAAVAGQRLLAGLDFEEADRPRVRMGLHTGSPVPHDGAYVGMDVHRGARVAAAAHGGQVVVSATTASAVRDDNALAVEFMDLGSHQLKDIAHLEQLFQVVGDGLEREFPPLRSLGTTTRLPGVRTELVGREGELAELSELVGPARLLTLTGPGGSGKTRLATAVAARVADRFSGGVFFVSLATARTEHAMWTTIAEALDLPAEGRVPPGFFENVAHRHTLLVLDNLEQVDGADQVVTDLLEHAPEAVVVATSRVPLHVRGEHEHPVPPLELPEAAGLSETARSGAVQLFVQQAQMVKPSFGLTAENAAAVAEICRRLDGLPLAVELAAARVKLLSPQALVKRLDQILDLGAQGVDRPSRQRTVRETIAWSYDLLPAEPQRFFDTLGVFAGGADLGSVGAVAGGDGIDVLDAVTALVDASLVTLRETDDGEPWIVLLETIRAFALERLESTGRLDQARRRHAEYYRDCYVLDMQIYRDASTGANGTTLDARKSRAWVLAHADNMRAALTWSLGDPVGPVGIERLDVGLSLVAFAEQVFWNGYLGEGLEWVVQAERAAAGRRSAAMVDCLMTATDIARLLGRWDDCFDYALRGAAIAATMNDPFVEAMTSGVLASALVSAGRLDEAREQAEAILRLAEEAHSRTHLMFGLSILALVERGDGEPERALSLDRAALELALELKALPSVLSSRHNIACSLRELGQHEEAFDELAAIAADVLASQEVERLCNYAEDLGCVIYELAHPAATARLIGAVEELRGRTGSSRAERQDDEIRGPMERARAALGEVWQSLYEQGAKESVEDVVDEAITAIRDARRDALTTTS